MLPDFIWRFSWKNTKDSQGDRLCEHQLSLLNADYFVAHQLNVATAHETGVMVYPKRQQSIEWPFQYNIIIGSQKNAAFLANNHMNNMNMKRSLMPVNGFEPNILSFESPTLLLSYQMVVELVVNVISQSRLIQITKLHF